MSLKNVTVVIDPASSAHPLSYWNTAFDSWVTAPGIYKAHVGPSSSSRDLMTDWILIWHRGHRGHRSWPAVTACPPCLTTNLGIYEELNPGAVNLLKGQIDGAGLYALPLELNVEGFWYNTQIFEENNLEVPTTWDEMLDAAATLQENGVQPFAVAGAESWPITRLINGYVMRYYGADAMARVSSGDLQVTDEGFVEAARIVQEMAENGYFGQGVTTIDYATAVDQAGLTTSISRARYEENPEIVGDWLTCVFSNYGDRAMSEQGLITGFRVEEMPEDVPQLTLLAQEQIDSVENGALWFEGRFNSRTQDVAWTNAQLLVTGDMTPEEYMSELQDAIDAQIAEQ